VQIKTIVNFIRMQPAKLPVIVALLVGLIALFKCFESKPFVDYERLSYMTNIQTETITTFSELTRFLVTTITLLFSAMAFFLSNLRNKLGISQVLLAYFISLLILISAYYSTYKIFAEITNDLIYESYAMKPGYSMITYYFDRALWMSILAGIILFVIFAYELWISNRSK